MSAAQDNKGNMKFAATSPHMLVSGLLRPSVNKTDPLNEDVELDVTFSPYYTHLTSNMI